MTKTRIENQPQVPHIILSHWSSLFFKKLISLLYSSVPNSIHMQRKSHLDNIKLIVILVYLISNSIFTIHQSLTLPYSKHSFLVYCLDIKFVVYVIIFANFISKWQDNVMTQILLLKTQILKIRMKQPKPLWRAVHDPWNGTASQWQR